MDWAGCLIVSVHIAIATNCLSIEMFRIKNTIIKHIMSTELSAPPRMHSLRKFAGRHWRLKPLIKTPSGQNDRLNPSKHRDVIKRPGLLSLVWYKPAETASTPHLPHISEPLQSMYKTLIWIY